jgi:hypothetical protein
MKRRESVALITGTAAVTSLYSPSPARAQQAERSSLHGPKLEPVWVAILIAFPIPRLVLGGGRTGSAGILACRFAAHDPKTLVVESRPPADHWRSKRHTNRTEPPCSLEPLAGHRRRGRQRLQFQARMRPIILGVGPDRMCSAAQLLVAL